MASLSTGAVAIAVGVPVITTLAGATLSALRPVSAQVRSMLQHFAAGVVFSVVAVEILPDIVRLHDVLEVVIGFTAGIVLLLVIRQLAEGGPEREATRVANVIVPSPRRQVERFLASSGKHAATATEPERAATGMFVAIGIDIVLDGLLLGIAFAAGQKEGLLLTAALSLELLSLGLATAAELSSRGVSRARAILIPSALALLLVPGAVIGVALLSHASEAVVATVLSFGCAALLYLVTEELLTEAHEVPETHATTASFFAGFLLFLVLGMVT